MQAVCQVQQHETCHGCAQNASWQRRVYEQTGFKKADFKELRWTLKIARLIPGVDAHCVPHGQSEGC
jgi:hypothetical protein